MDFLKMNKDELKRGRGKMHSWLLRSRAVHRGVCLLPLLLENELVKRKYMWTQRNFVTFTTFRQMVLYVHKKDHLSLQTKKNLTRTGFLQPLQLTTPQPPSSFPQRNNLSSSVEASTTHFHSQNGHSSRPTNPASLISFCCSNLS